MEIVQLLLPSGSFSHVPDLSNELTKPIDRSIDRFISRPIIEPILRRNSYIYIYRIYIECV